MQALITAQSSQKKQRFVIKFDPKEMGWKSHDIIRVISKKKENKIILKRVNKKYVKQVAYTLTSTGRGDFSFNEGIFVPFKTRRFMAKPSTGKSAEVTVTMGYNQMEFQMPQEVFAQ
ncbi:hypothetical protein GW796_08795 [archaeon]|nr:hypothetical protein [archaeon]NCQ51976.1 hypothetical protein [archaeon]